MSVSIISFNFTKVDVQRKDGSAKKVSINNNVGLTNVEKASVGVKNEDSTALKFTFLYECKFEPNVGHITLEGTVLTLFPAKEATTVLDEWEKSKHIPVEQATKVMNSALSRAQVFSLNLAQELNLPLPVRLPKVVPKK